MKKKTPFDVAELELKKPKYKGFISESHYIPMRDGVKIAADVLLPKKLPNNKTLPTVLIQTRYWRAIELKKPFKWLVKFATNPIYCKKMVKYGFAVVETDARGTGASYGTRKYPSSPEEIQDSKDIIDWIISQSWSNKEVITWGNSYTGMTSELTATQNHPNVKGHVIKHDPWDLYEHAMFPGGVFNEAFIKYWSRLGQGLDQTKGEGLKAFRPFEPLMGILAPRAVVGVKSVGEDREELEEVAKIHQNNKYPFDYGDRVIFRDDPAEEDGTTIGDLSIYTKQQAIEKENIPLYTWGSWQDSATADIVLSRFSTFSNPQKAIIGDWNHMGFKKANPYFSHKEEVYLDKESLIKEWLSFGEDCIQGHVPKSELYYFTMGEEQWKMTTQWPPEGQSSVKWYFDEGNMLSPEKPEVEEASDEYKVNFNTSTGIRNRWYTLLSVPVKYPDREVQDKMCLTYTSSPLEEDVEITGHPIVNLYLSSTHEDGMVHVHLEFIDDTGEIHWITDGQLRLIHRKISSESPPYKIFVPYHSYLRKDNLPLVPGEVAEIKLGLYPTSVLIKKGSRLRIAISGADKDSFRRYPAEGNPILSIQRNNSFASHIDLPVIKKKD